ncbi:MAG: hypothetical protein RMM29_03815 [Planctomycetota bacterium]|nr:hypothetical protein [Planctomycetota bacterium]MCX8038987.1 hypothetical protein [Planctomycetota bacterium]MDW8372762.1 hypothetical protein [Planctomycetota bacterium]
MIELVPLFLPSAALAVAGAPAWLLASQGAAAAWSGRLAAVALGAALAGSLWWLRGWPSLPPVNVHDWPLWFSVLAAAFSLASALAWRWFVPLTAAVVIACSLAVLTVPRRGWSTGEAWLWTALLAAAWLMTMVAARWFGERLPSAAAAAWLGMLAVGAALVMTAGSASTALWLAACAGASAVLALCAARSAAFAAAPVLVVLALLVPAWLVLAHLSTDRLRWPSVVLLWAAPLSALLAWPWRARRWLAAVLAAGFSALVAAAAWWFVPPLPSRGW